VPLYTKCLRCGGWRLVPEDPSGKAQFPTGLMMNTPTAPGKMCTCDEERAAKTDS